MQRWTRGVGRVRKSLLYAADETIILQDYQDSREHEPRPVYLFEITSARANPFGIISYGLHILDASRYSHDHSLMGLQRLRMVLAQMLKTTLRHDGRLLVVTHSYYDCFYHFYHEVLVRIFLLRHYLREDALILMPQRLHPYHDALIDLLGLRRNMLFVADNVIVKAREVVTCSFPASSSNYHRLVSLHFRDWLITAVGHREPVAGVGSRVFVGRNGNRRKIANLDAVRAIVRDFGFEYVEMENFGLEQQIRIFMHATHVVAIHGGALSHLIFAPSSCTVIELVHKDFHIHFYGKLCAVLGMKYQRLGCSSPSTHNVAVMPNHSDLWVDTDKLARALADLG
jgi:capsular polysaccharide biosynthesis protein